MKSPFFNAQNLSLSCKFKKGFEVKIITQSLACLAIGASLSLSGCNSEDAESLLDNLPGSENTENKFCEANTAPFNHTLCEVSQDSLEKSKKSLSLHLFWKSGQWHSENDKSNSNASSIADSNISNKKIPDNNISAKTIPDKESTRPPLYKFESLINDLPESSSLVFATNAGMYNSDFAPIGYTVIQGEQILSLNLNEGAGNFHLMPNGVLWWGKDMKIHITESNELAKQLDSKEVEPWYATQSGPMLVIDGVIHPKFNPDSTSLKIRNGVGVCRDNNIKFVTSHEPVNFFQFASLFAVDLDCDNALFLDGGIASALYSPETNQLDTKNMGVMVGLVKDESFKPER